MGVRPESSRRDSEETISRITYDNLILNGLRYITTNIKELECMTLREYYLQIKANRLRKIDRMSEYSHKLLIKRRAEETEKRRDKLYYKRNSVKDIYNYEIEESKLTDEQKEDSELVKLVKRMEKFKMKGGNDE